MGGIAAALACGLVCGAVIALAWSQIVRGLANPYGRWLERTCWVRPLSRPDRWRKCVVVAVSWRGAVCVREADKLDQDGYWIKKQNVEWRVRWAAPTETEETDA